MRTVLGFNDFKDQERVVAIVRHHWWVLVREAFLLVILFVLPFFLVPLVFFYVSQGGGGPSVSGGAVLFFASAWSLIMWNLLFARWTDYYFDIWIITNWRIIDIDQQGFFKRNTSTLLTLDHIEDIETEIDGVVGNLLNFGHVQVQTAAAKDEFFIDDVPNPTGVDEMIRAAQEEELRLFGSGMSARHATGVITPGGM